MLIQRIITAALLLPLIIYAILKFSSASVLILASLAILLSFIEWLKIVNQNLSRLKIFSYNLLFIVLSTMIFFNFKLLHHIIEISVGLWLSIILLIIFNNKILFRIMRFKIIANITGIFLLITALFSIYYIHVNKSQGPILLLYLFCTVWGADTIAYFVGKKFGKRKLSVAISPGKTWEGVVGALLGGFIVVFMFHRYFEYSAFGDSFIIEILSIQLVVIFSIYGDLFESVIKRINNVKDSGNLLPGHGGMLDRIDALLAAAPMFAVLL